LVRPSSSAQHSGGSRHEKEFSLHPGPSNVPPEVLAAIARPIIITARRFRSGLQRVLPAAAICLSDQESVLTFASSGSGALEAAVTGVLSPATR